MKSESNSDEATEIEPTPKTRLVPVQEMELAPHASRIAAFFVDALLMLAFLVPGMLFVGWDRIGRGDTTTIVAHRLFLLACSIPFYLLNGYFVGMTGQTLGKRLLRIQIRKLDNSLPTASEWFYKRNLPMILVNQIPMAGGWIVFASYLMVLGTQRRCGHDWIAGTKVVQV